MNVKNTRLVLSLLLLGAQSVFAQQVQLSGILRDATQQPLEFVNVFVQDITDPSQQLGTITDLDGSFQLDLSANATYLIRLSFIGYEDWQQTLELKQSLDLGYITMHESVNELKEVLITAERNIISRKEDKLVFNVGVSPLKSGFDGLDVLQRAPYVMVGSEGNISMRNEAPTVMINGRISNLRGADLTNYLRNIRSEDIKSIEIQTHLSAHTDAESSGGVINIILHKKQKGFDANVRAGYTLKGAGFKDIYGGVNFNYGADRWNIYGTYNYFFDSSESDIQQSFRYHIDQSSILTKENYMSQLNNHNIRLGLVANLSANHLIGWEAFATDRLYSFESIGGLDIFEGDNRIENGTALTSGLVDNQLYNLTLNYAWTIDTLNSNLKIYADYANQDVSRTNSATSIYTQGLYTNLSERNIAPAKTLIYSAQADLEKYFRNGFKLETGSKWTYTDRENILFSDILSDNQWLPTDRTTSFTYTEQVLAAYAALNKNLDKKTFIEIGLRLEHTKLNRIDLSDNTRISKDYSNLFPSFYLSRDLAENTSISLSFSKRLRRPPFQFLNNNAVKINDFRYELGNPDLIPEKVNNLELSLKQKKQSFDLYYQRTTEAINGIYYLDGQIAYYQKFNEGVQQQIGLTYNRFGYLTSWWHIKGLLNVFYRKFINEAGEDSFTRTTARLNLSNNFKINETTSLDLTARYTSPYEDAYYIAYERYRFDLMLQKLCLNKKLTARIYIQDLFNTLVYGEERPFENFNSIRSQRWRSRNVQLWLSYNFSSQYRVNNRKNKSKNAARSRL